MQRDFHRGLLALTLIGLVSPATAQSVSSELSTLPVLRTYSNHRVSSHDRTGANDDGNWQNPIRAGETWTIAEIDGPAIIGHTTPPGEATTSA